MIKPGELYSVTDHPHLKLKHWVGRLVIAGEYAFENQWGDTYRCVDDETGLPQTIEAIILKPLPPPEFKTTDTETKKPAEMT